MSILNVRMRTVVASTQQLRDPPGVGSFDESEFLRRLTSYLCDLAAVEQRLPVGRGDDGAATNHPWDDVLDHQTLCAASVPAATFESSE